MHRSVLAISVCLAACGATTAAVPADLDLDGILDARDDCPRVPEELDGFEDDDGCPDPDNDGDGIVDIADLCPCDDEDGDEWEDTDGCPDPDNDADRLHDACDLCPDEPETYNGICDEDGCPDRSGICVEEARIAIVDTIPFAPSSARIDPSFQPIVRALASTLNGNPQLERIVLVGHATTHERRSTALSLRRAEVVRDAIGALGVARERLEVRGEAPAAPVTGDPREGRFVSFVLLRVSGEDWTAGEPPPRPGGGCGARRCEPVPACTPPVPAPSECGETRGAVAHSMSPPS